MLLAAMSTTMFSSKSSGAGRKWYKPLGAVHNGRGDSASRVVVRGTFVLGLTIISERVKEDKKRSGGLNTPPQRDL